MLGALVRSGSVLARVLKRGGRLHHRYDAFSDEEEPCPEHGFRVDPEEDRRRAGPRVSGLLPAPWA